MPASFFQVAIEDDRQHEQHARDEPGPGRKRESARVPGLGKGGRCYPTTTKKGCRNGGSWDTVGPPWKIGMLSGLKSAKLGSTLWSWAVDITARWRRRPVIAVSDAGSR